MFTSTKQIYIYIYYTCILPLLVLFSWLTFVKGCSDPSYFMHVVTCGHLLQDAYTMMRMHADICRYWTHAYLATRSGAIMKASNQANT